jgi:hypothetical protein
MVHEPFVAANIPFAIRVLTTIDFDDQPSFPTNEICNEWTYRLLADEFVPIQGA